MTKSATQKLADLRQLQAELAAEEQALTKARLDEIAVLVDRAGGAALPDEIVVGMTRLAVNGGAELQARLHQDGASFLGGSRRRSSGKSRPAEGAPGPAAVVAADVVRAAPHATDARQDGAQSGEREVANG